MRIHTAKHTDAPGLAALLARVFTATYGAAIPPHILAPYLQRVFDPAAVAAQLGRHEAPVLVASAAGALAGVAMLEPGAPKQHVLPSAIELARLYVDGAWQGRGVGRALLESAIASARSEGYATMWLCVWKRNEAARAFYQAHSFQEFGHTPVWVDDIRFDDLLMQRTIV